MPQYSGIWTEQAVMQAVGAGNWPGNPGAPTIGTATAGDASASVTFTAPTNNGGSAITSYTVTSSPGGITGTGASSPITVSGLTNGTAYTFTVTATNATGTGPASAASNSVTPAEPVYIEQTFSTYLYTGNGSTQTITNGINLSTYGGLVWTKDRTSAIDNELTDTVRGAGLRLISNNSTAQGGAGSSDTTSFTTTGFGLTYNNGGGNLTGEKYASWTFREQAKFFDIVTYTGTGSVQSIPHNLGSVPGCIIVKCTSQSSTNWAVYHRRLNNGTTPENYLLFLNDTMATAGPSSAFWGGTAPTSTNFYVGNYQNTGASGFTYVAYLFAHNAGGFGLNGTDNVISCGSFTKSSGVVASITLGYEPQWLLFKRTDTAENWFMIDNMRGMTMSTDAYLIPNLSNAESNLDFVTPTATGFEATNNFNNGTYIYIAIRRGPMKTPTLGTSVFQPASFTSTASRQTMGSLPVVDMFFGKRTNSITNWGNAARLTGDYMLKPNLTDAQDTNVTGYGDSVLFDLQNGSSMVSSGSGDPFMTYNVKRAPGFFDVMCWTGDGVYGRLLNHNLGVVPEMVIIKSRSNAVEWVTWQTDLGGTYPSARNYLYLNATSAVQTSYQPMEGAPTSTQLNLRPSSAGNASGYTYIAYLFASCPGVSKVGSYTGTGALQTINCGFAAGARFVLIKRTDSTGDWWTYDSARGLTSGNDPYLFLNSTAAEVTGTNYVDTTSVGFQVTAAAPAGLNANGGTYIFLAIA